MEIALGTANFGQKYGLLNNIINDQNEFEKISKFFKQKKIKYLDTALSYNLPKKKFSKSKIITKIKLPPKKINTFLDNLENIILIELKKKKLNHFEAILLHNVNDLKSKYAKKFINKLNELKKLKYTKKIGVSVYEPNELSLIFKFFNPEIIQMPMNIFDNRFQNSSWIKKLKKKKILIQARSIFLQGLLTRDINYIKKKKLKKSHILKLQEFDLWCQINKISKIEACIEYIKSIKEVDIITIGVNSFKDIKEIISTINNTKKFKLKKFTVNDRYLIDPRKWKKN